MEADIRVIVDREMRPIAENLTSLLVDIVRRRQSTVEENFRMSRRPRLGDGIDPSLQERGVLPSSQADENRSINDTLSAEVNVDNRVTDFFREPPHLAMDVGSSYTGLPLNINPSNSSQSPLVDSGYGSSMLGPCSCICHYMHGLDLLTGGMAFPCSLMMLG